jgi:SAM-dependent methyltransferase
MPVQKVKKILRYSTLSKLEWSTCMAISINYKSVAGVSEAMQKDGWGSYLEAVSGLPQVREERAAIIAAVDRVLKIINPSTRLNVWDVGCGKAVFTCAIARYLGQKFRPVSVSGCDKNPDIYKKWTAQERALVQLYGTDAETFFDNMATDSQDIGLATRVLQHCPRVDIFMVKALRVIKPGTGALIITDGDQTKMTSAALETHFDDPEFSMYKSGVRYEIRPRVIIDKFINYMHKKAVSSPDAIAQAKSYIESNKGTYSYEETVFETAFDSYKQAKPLIKAILKSIQSPKTPPELRLSKEEAAWVGAMLKKTPGKTWARPTHVLVCKKELRARL